MNDMHANRGNNQIPHLLNIKDEKLCFVLNQRKRFIDASNKHTTRQHFFKTLVTLRFDFTDFVLNTCQR